MKIINLQAENIKRLTAVSITPDGNTVEITGKNGQGKTSVLDAIWWALAGKENVQDDPIRHGAESARIQLDLGELKVTRTFRMPKDPEGGGYTTSVIVESADGARFQSPQKVLDALLGSLTFDPLAFTKMKPAEQFDVLKVFVPGFDFADVERKQEVDYQKRADANRRVKELRASAAQVTEYPKELVEAVPVDEAALVAELEAAGQANQELQKRQAQRGNVRTDINRLQTAEADNERRILNLEAEVGLLMAQKEDNKRSREALQEKLANAEPLPEPIDTAAIKTKIAEAKVSNAKIEIAQRAAKTRESRLADAVELELVAAGYTTAMYQRDEAKAAAIAEAKMPVDGLTFTTSKGPILLNGVPFNQAADAEQLHASIAIAAAMNPKLRVIRVRDGSLLDDDGMKMLAQFADEHDMQVWIERVDSSGKVGFVIEDGHLKV